MKIASNVNKTFNRTNFSVEPQGIGKGEGYFFSLSIQYQFIDFLSTIDVFKSLGLP